VLPTLENIFYGANLSNILSAHKHVVLDVLAWLPYGIGHFGAPFVCSAILFIWGPPGTLPVFARAFGYLSLLGVFINLVFPCSPPWYENHYGLVPADYSVPGEAAGLARIDQLFGVDMYTSTFAASPSPFGAFPSLHAADATLEALFLGHVFPKLLPVFIGYVLWLWWATMYLSHHYAVDLVAGSLLASAFFFVSRSKWLPRVQSDKQYRWDYDYVEKGDPQDSWTSSVVDFYEEFQPHSDSDEWTIGSSSAYASSTRSPSTGSRSPIDDGHSMWEGDTLASHSDHEQSR
jgi:inositol phosphorylceramide synthase catalytic subunit